MSDDRKHARLEHKAFPKTCRHCGRVYENEIDFFRQTDKVSMTKSDIRAIDNDPVMTNVYLEVYRNCACGSTLMEYFHCQRDLSARGLERRAQFERLLHGLRGNGLSLPQARRMLLDLVALFSSAQDQDTP